VTPAPQPTGTSSERQRGALPIERIRVRVLEVTLDQPVPMSFSSLRSRRACFIEVHAGGLVGVGESWANYPSWAWAERVATVSQGVAPLLLGTDAADVRGVHDRLVRSLSSLGRQWGAPGPIWQAISGVDLALWDLHGKAAGRAVAQLLSAAPRDGVPAYASGVGPDQAAELAERALRADFNALKVKVGFGRDRDEATLRAVRSVGGDQVRVFADANQAWSLPEAAEMCAVLREYGVEWCEEPLADNVLEDLEELHRSTGMPLATGENVYSLAAFRRYVQSPAVAQIQPDVAKTGGLTTALAVADLAADHGTLVSPHCYTSALTVAGSAQLAAARREVDWVELDIRDNPLRTSLTAEPFVVRDGLLQVPSGPGLGVVLDEDRIRSYEIDVKEKAR